MPFQPSTIPTTSKDTDRFAAIPESSALFVTHLIAPLRPGQSPPPVNIAIFIFMVVYFPLVWKQYKKNALACQQYITAKSGLISFLVH
jgi:hypothetical protein